jgi:hypothetical protein
MVLKRVFNEYIENKSPVLIDLAELMGEEMYAVVPERDPSFWLDAFITRKGAEAFCKRYKLPVVAFTDSRSNKK